MIDSLNRVAKIVRASLAIVDGDVGVVATGRVTAQVLGARVVIFANSGNSLATIGIGSVARVDHALEAKVAVLGGVRATR